MEVAHQNGYRNKSCSKLSRGPPFKVLVMGNLSRMWPVLLLCSILLAWSLWATYGKDLKVQELKSFDLAKTSQETYTVIKTLDWLLVPVAGGLAFIFLSWSVIYLDSNRPGTDPPLPMSSNGINFHLQYATSLYVAILVSMILIYDKWEYDEPILV